MGRFGKIRDLRAKMLACAALAIVTHADAALAGGSGMRGGAGVLCAGDRAAIVLEDYIVSGRTAVGDPIDAGNLLAKLPPGEDFLRNEIRAQLRTNRAATEWETTEQIRKNEETFRLWTTHHFQIDAATRFYLYRLFFGAPRIPGRAESYRVFDEELDVDLGRHCQLVQLAVTVVGRDYAQLGPILLGEGQRLELERQRDLLALHEAVYLVGLRMGHLSPVPTRNLIVALLRHPAGHGEIAAAAGVFRAYAQDHEMLLRVYPELHPLRYGQLQLVRTAGPTDRCPPARIVSFVGGGFFAVKDFPVNSRDLPPPFRRMPTSDAAKILRDGDCVYGTAPWGVSGP